jgi:hypothetical protein
LGRVFVDTASSNSMGHRAVLGDSNVLLAEFGLRDFSLTEFG